MKKGEDKDEESDVERNGNINLNDAHDSDRDDKGEVATATADTTRLQGDQNIPKPEGQLSFVTGFYKPRKLIEGLLKMFTDLK